MNDEIKQDLDNIIINLISNYNNFLKFYLKCIYYFSCNLLRKYAAFNWLLKNLTLTRFNFTAKDDSMIIKNF